MTKNLDQIINSLMSDFSPKHQRVLFGRFGLKTGGRATLQEIGDELHITRERVRQIEAQSIKKLKDRVKEHAGYVVNFTKDYLKNAGGIRKDDFLISEVLHKLSFDKTKHAGAKLRFILLIAGEPFYYKEDDNFHAFWYDDKKSEKKFLDFIKQMNDFLKSTDRGKIFDEKAHLSVCKDFISSHILSIPKHFGMNVFGDFGLRSWPEIEPKTIRDKAYLALKKHEKPLHFVDIAKNITRLGIDKKPAHVQTVHNELIKDARFVLVGRGMYALKEYGYEPGTVREVIQNLLKNKGPLMSPDIVRLVNERRFLKENTILLNLQNRKFFKRLEDGKYHVKEV